MGKVSDEDWERIQKLLANAINRAAPSLDIEVWDPEFQGEYWPGLSPAEVYEKAAEVGIDSTWHPEMDRFTGPECPKCGEGGILILGRLGDEFVWHCRGCAWTWATRIADHLGDDDIVAMTTRGSNDA